MQVEQWLRLNDDGLWARFELNGKHFTVNLDNLQPARWFATEYRQQVEAEKAAALQGWKPHPTSPGYYYKGAEIRTHAELADECRGLSPEALTAAVWSGEGLPPVGCVSQVQDADGEWHECQIIAHHLHNAVFVPHAAYPYGVYDGLPVGRFRPLRTAEQLAAEAREKAIAEMCEVTGEKITTRAAGILYDAGYRKADA